MRGVCGGRSSLSEQLKELRKIHGSYLKQEREKRSISVKKIAMGIGVSENRIRRLEKGEPVMDGFMMERTYIYFLELIKNDVCPFSVYGKFQSGAMTSCHSIKI